jgi:Rieske Fe-S protein
MSDRQNKNKDDKGRRDFMANVFMGAGLVTSHVFAAGLAIRYLYPVQNDQKQRLFVGLRSEIPPGSAFTYEAPGGKTINIVRGTKGFIALSDVCPHLGCRVHWESRTKEFVCPCHDGHFDANGAPVSGPPAEMKAGLPKYDIVTDGDIIYLELEVQG